MLTGKIAVNKKVTIKLSKWFVPVKKRIDKRIQMFTDNAAITVPRIIKVKSVIDAAISRYFFT